MRGGLLALGVAALVGCLTGPHQTLALTITIDDSTDTLSVTSSSSTTQITTGTGATITDSNGNQFALSAPGGGPVIVEWAAILDSILSSVPLSDRRVVILLEPGTNLASDILDPSNGPLLVGSDVEGQPPIDFNDFSAFCAASAQVACLSETGGYQELGSLLFPTVANLSIQFRSDLADVAVPEPGSLALLLSALGALLGLARLRRWNLMSS